MSKDKGKISANLSDVVLQDILQKIRDIRSQLPFLIQLTPAERREGWWIGEKSAEFVKRSYAIAGANRSLVPPWLDFNEWERDMEIWTKLEQIEREIKSLTEAIEDTRMAAGSDAIQHALVFYGALKQQKQANVPGVDTYIEELKWRFPRGKRKDTNIDVSDDQPPTE